MRLRKRAQQILILERSYFQNEIMLYKLQIVGHISQKKKKKKKVPKMTLFAQICSQMV